MDVRAMSKLIDLTGRAFGRLTVLRRGDAPANDRTAWWFCRCSCGASVTTAGGRLRLGQTQSCGCLHREVVSALMTTHGAAGRDRRTPEYVAWRSMIARCYTPSATSYPRYGALGVTVCDRWRESFESFLADVGRRPSGGHSIDRINNACGYEPDNVRWATATEQSLNRGSAVVVTIGEETLPLAAWLERYGTSRDRYYQRRRKGWSIPDAITRPFVTYDQRGKRAA